MLNECLPVALRKVLRVELLGHLEGAVEVHLVITRLFLVAGGVDVGLCGPGLDLSGSLGFRLGGEQGRAAAGFARSGRGRYFRIGNIVSLGPQLLVQGRDDFEEGPVLVDGKGDALSGSVSSWCPPGKGGETLDRITFLPGLGSPLAS